MKHAHLGPCTRGSSHEASYRSPLTVTATVVEAWGQRRDGRVGGLAKDTTGIGRNEVDSRVVEQDDWRLFGQESYLHGVTLAHRKWTQIRVNWDHDHCEFCWTTFPDEAEAGYCTPDESNWICDACFEDFKDMLEWRVIPQ